MPKQRAFASFASTHECLEPPKVFLLHNHGYLLHASDLLFFDETVLNNSSQRAMNRLLFPSVGKFLGSKKLFTMTYLFLRPKQRAFASFASTHECLEPPKSFFVAFHHGFSYNATPETLIIMVFITTATPEATYYSWRSSP